MNAPVPTIATYSLAIMDPAQFDHMQRVGKMLALSPLFPEHLRKGGIETAIANGVLVINMALRLREDPLTVAQNIYFVGGKPGWSASYLIAKANQHGVFDGPIEWKVEGQGDSLSVTAYATLIKSGRTVSVTCDMALAKAEGWVSNKKYQTMPAQMLRYRSATWLVRLYCPEILVGVPAAIDHEIPMRDVTPDPEPVISRRSVEREPDLVTNDTATEAKAEAQPAEEAKPAPQTAAQSAPAADPKPAAAQTAPVAKSANGTDYDAIYKTILKDLVASGGDISGIKEFYGSALDEMAVNARDLFAQLQDEFAKAEGLGEEGGAA